MQFHASAQQGGSIIYHNLIWVSNIWTLEASPNLGLVRGEPIPVTKDLIVKLSPNLSRDGSRLAYSTFSGLKRAHSEVRLKELASGEERIIPMRTVQIGNSPMLSPDGSVLSYRDVVEGELRAFIVSGQDTIGRKVCDSWKRTSGC